MKCLATDKKGSSMVEAAIIFPFIILVVLSLITITIWFYEEGVSLTALHIDLWDQSQQESATGKDIGPINMYAPADTYGKSAFNLEKDLEKKQGLPFRKIKALADVRHNRNGFFPYSVEMDLLCQIYIINEMDYVRCYDAMIRGE